MSLQNVPDNQISAEAITELPDPFVSRGLINRLSPPTRRRVSRVKQWVGKALTPASVSKNTAAWSPFVSGFDREAGRPLTGRALMIYVNSGFHMTSEQLRHSRHSNHAQGVEIACAFNRLGYCVDVVDLWDSETVPQGKYDIIFGEHDNFGRLLPKVDRSTLKIFYGTRSYWAAEQQAIRERAQRIQQTRGDIVPVKDWEPENNWVQQSDAVIAIGNSVTAGTFGPYHSQVYKIDNSALPLGPPALENKDFADARKNFLWLGSGTLLRKGLDLVLEAFAGLPDLHLWVCGPLEDHNELEFLWAYRRELFHTLNIHPIGLVKLQSETMKAIVNKCAALVFTSCSEGMSGGVLDCMAQGLIPIISAETGIDTEDFGVTLEQSDVKAVRLAVLKIAGMPPEVCRRMGVAAYHQTQTRYTLSAFRENIEYLLKTAIESGTRDL